MRRILFLRIAVCIVIIGLFALPVIAQKQKTISIDKDREFHIVLDTRPPQRRAEAWISLVRGYLGGGETMFYFWLPRLTRMFF